MVLAAHGVAGGVGPMMSAIGFLLALGLLAAARFCVQPAHTYRAWWVALVATELGHVGALLALGLATGMTVLASHAAAAGWELGLAALAAGVALSAAGLFARPAWSAWRMSGHVARELDRAFAAVAGGEGVERLWSWSRLWSWPNRVVCGPVETFALQTGAAGEANGISGVNAAGLPVDFYRARGGGRRGCARGCGGVCGGGAWRRLGQRRPGAIGGV